MTQHSIARSQLRAFVERIERLEEEKKSIADDIKDVYGEAKSMGFDTKILKMVISLRKKDEQERTEQEMILDTYLQALGMTPAFEREEVQTAKDDGDHEVTAKLVATVATGMQTEIGRKALVTALDILIEREESEDPAPATQGDADADFDDGQRLPNLAVSSQRSPLRLSRLVLTP